MAAYKLQDEDLEIVHTKGSGPGGQNRNKRMSGIRMVHLPTGIVVMATERRSQAQNLKIAYDRMEEKLKKRFHKVEPRVPTHTTRSAHKKRLTRKKTRSVTKLLRKRISDTSDY